MNTEQCEGCVYWNSVDGGERNVHFCHHLLHTGKRRKHDGDKCLSRKEEEKHET